MTRNGRNDRRGPPRDRTLPHPPRGDAARAFRPPAARSDADRPDVARRDGGRRDAPREPASTPPKEERRGGGPGQVWLYGRHAVLAALANAERRVFRILAAGDALERARAAVADLRKAGRTLPEPETADRSQLGARLPPGAVHQGLAAQVGGLPDFQIEDVLARGGGDAVVVALDQVTDPHNVGAILRSAEAFGAAGVLVTDRHAPDDTGVLAKSASGALERMPLVRVVNLSRALEQLKEAGFWCVALDERGEKTLEEAALTGKVALVMGAEGEGLRRLTFERCDLAVRLPMRGEMPSINVSNAAAIGLYELAKRRGTPPRQ